MPTLYDSWPNIRTIAQQNDVTIRFFESTNLYKIYILHAQNMHIVELWKDTSKVKGIDVAQNDIDVADFETNFKNVSEGLFNDSPVLDIQSQTVEATLLPKKSYKSATINVTGTEQEFDLGAVFPEFTILITGVEKVIIKFNDATNDEIPLEGGESIRDLIGSDTFELKKIFHKTADPLKTSEIFLWATKI